MKKNIVLACTTFVAVFVILFLSTPVNAGEKGIKLRYTNFWPPAHPLTKLSDAWGKEIEKRTNGRVTVKQFPGGTLTSMTQTYDSVVKEVADVGQSPTSYCPGRFPLTEVLGLPLGYSSAKQVTRVANAYYRKFRPKEFDDTKVMYFYGSGPSMFSLRKTVSSIEGIKDLRFRVNPENAPIVKNLGGVPVFMAISETYDAFQKGLLDGTLGPVEALKGFRFAEILKCTLENHATGSPVIIYVVMNKKKWNAISKEDQAVIEKINEEWIDKKGKMWYALDQGGKDFSLQNGGTFVRASKEEEAATAKKLEPILEDYVKNMKSKGLPAEEALQFCKDYIKAHP